MNVVNALKDEQLDVRASCGFRWLVWHNSCVWTVYERRPYAKITRVIITTVSEHDAVARLVEEA